MCLKVNIGLEIQWVPRELNSFADSISKTSNTDEWSISRDFFEYLNGRSGPILIDRLATVKNGNT